MAIILITGAGRRGNLGHETAKQLGEAGHAAILAARKEGELADLADELKNSGIDTLSSGQMENHAGSVRKDGRFEKSIIAWSNGNAWKGSRRQAGFGYGS